MIFLSKGLSEGQNKLLYEAVSHMQMHIFETISKLMQDGKDTRNEQEKLAAYYKLGEKFKQ